MTKISIKKLDMPLSIEEHKLRYRGKELLKAKAKRAALSSKWRFRRHCAVCGIGFVPYVPFQMSCTPKCRKTAIWKLKGTRPLEHKAWSMGANLVMGSGKSQKILNLLKSCLNSACVYCGVVLTLENISLDHKEPYDSHIIRRNKAVNRVERERLDAIENLQIICKLCNLLKGNWSDRQFKSLLGFLDSDRDMKDKLFKRLKMATRGFRR